MADSRAEEILQNRFEAKFVRVEGCWLWTASRTTFGYGKMMFNGRLESAHRISWKLYRGPIPDGLCVLHRCDVPQCVNPDHLFLGTMSDNTQDCIAKKRNRPPRGEVCGRAKLTEQQVREIRAISGRLPDGEAQRLAARYGVHDATIWRIRKSKRWGHINV